MSLERLGEQHVPVVDKYHDLVDVDYTMTTRDYVVRASAVAAVVAITLPSVAEAKGRIYTIVARAASSAFPITIQDRDDSEGWTYDAVLSAAGELLVLYSDGLKWNKGGSGSSWDDNKARVFDDFFGEAYDTVFWGTTETALNTAIALDQDAIGGILELILDADDNAEIAAVHFGDNESLYLGKGLIFEARVAWSVLPLTGTETVQSVVGVAGAHNAVLDTIDCSAWFRIESAANTALLWETDDNVTNDDDNATGIVLVASQYYVLRIDFTDLAHVRFYVDGVLVGTGAMAPVGAVGQVQPYLNISKAVAANNTGTGTMLIDYIKIIQNRA